MAFTLILQAKYDSLLITYTSKPKSMELFSQALFNLTSFKLIPKYILTP